MAGIGWSQTDEGSSVTEKADGRNAAEIAEKLTEQVTFGSNMRGSSEYRKALAKVLIRRQIEALMEEC